MNIHEYQAKEILRRYGVVTLAGKLAFTPEEAVAAAKSIGGDVWVVKAQIHAGGRGKGGGVKLAKSLDDVKANAKSILGMNLVTHQTGPEGKKVHQIFIEAGCKIQKELYAACLLDRESSRVVLMVSSEGGMDIEEVAANKPDAIYRVTVDPVLGLMPYQVREIIFKLGIDPKLTSLCQTFFKGLYEAFVNEDAALLEINPMVITADQKVIALDAKMGFDSNALFRHQKTLEMRDLREEDPAEVEASKYDLAFIKLDGNIGCLVNGAGLAMATLDIIQLNGAKPANFLDVGGGATTEKVTAAFKIILKDPNVKAILVNIFGGIMKCDVIAEGVVAASKEVGLKVPLIVRLEGTNVELGQKILRESGLKILPAKDLKDAAEQAVAAIKG